MAKAKTEDGMLRVRFAGIPGPPARLVAGDVVIEQGRVGELPAALARELAADPQMGVELTDEPLTESTDEVEASVEVRPDGEVVHQHENPPADEPEKE
jgi:hypothetical protein